MTARRAARGTPRAVPSDNAVPDELSSRLHPFWRDPEAVMAQYGLWLDDNDLRSMRMGRRLYYKVLRLWALEHGYRSSTDPTSADFHALRRAGIIHDSPAILRAEGRHSSDSPSRPADAEKGRS